MKKKAIEIVQWGIILLFVAFTLSAVYFRLFLHGDIYDEIVNLSIAYRMALGQKPIFDMWEAYQTAGVYLALYIKLFLSFSLTTEGIVVYSRLVYFLNLIVLATFSYIVLKNIINKKIALLISNIVLCFNLFGLYYLWYDSVCVIFYTWALLYVLNYLIKKKKIYLYLSGIFLGMMAFSYPQFLIIAIFTVICCGFALKGDNITKLLKEIKWQVFGGLTILIIAIIYFSVNIGIENCIIGINEMIASRVKSNGPDRYLKDIFLCFYKINFFSTKCFVIMLLIYIGCRVNRKFIPYLCISSVIIAGVNQIFIDKQNMGLPNYIAFIGLCAPFYTTLIKSKEQRALLNILWIPSFLSILVIAFSSISSELGPVKCWEALLPAAIASFVAMYILLNEYSGGFKKNIIYLITVFSAIILIETNYQFYYLEQSQYLSNIYKIESGIYKDLYVTKEMLLWEDIEKYIDKKVKESDTLMVGSRLAPIYLMSKGTIYSPTVASINTERVKRYISVHKKYPSIVIIESNNLSDTDTIEFLETNYKFIENKYFGQFCLNIYRYKNK